MDRDQDKIVSDALIALSGKTIEEYIENEFIIFDHDGTELIYTVHIENLSFFHARRVLKNIYKYCNEVIGFQKSLKITKFFTKSKNNKYNILIRVPNICDKDYGRHRATFTRLIAQLLIK